MSDFQPEGTVKERLTRMEVMLCNHLTTHDKRDKWTMRILCGLVVGILLLGVPGAVKLFAAVL